MWREAFHPWAAPVLVCRDGERLPPTPSCPGTVPSASGVPTHNRSQQSLKVEAEKRRLNDNYHRKRSRSTVKTGPGCCCSSRLEAIPVPNSLVQALTVCAFNNPSAVFLSFLWYKPFTFGPFQQAVLPLGFH